ncbi:cytochrome P450 [Rhodococcus sp. O3]|uniref:cytochrome P450 n=1 Tax=Rhodococcus sp. O3 TaxID=3404919 RepID=UPI003B66DC76
MAVATSHVFDTEIPHPPWRLPVLGDVLGMSVSTPVQDSMELHRRLGPVFERRPFDLRFVFVCSGELTAELSDDRRFAKHLAPGVEALRSLGGDGLFTAYNDEPNWRRAHDLLAPAFTQSAMRSYHATMLDVTADLLAHWDRRAAEGGRVDVAADMTKLTLETIGRTGFSYSFSPFERDRPHPFVEAMVGGLAFSQRSALRRLPVIGRYLFPRQKRQYLLDRAYLHRVVDEVIRERQAAGETGHDDLLELMLRAARENDPNRIDDENIRNQVLTFLVAGHETTSGALSFALYYLMRNPGVFARARAEVDAVWGEDVPAFEQVAKLRYVRRVLDEALRLWPTAPGYAREAREDTTLGGRYRLRKGDWVLVLLPAVHRDPEVWGPDAETFDPDHFLPERVRARPGHVYKPFGTGERACIGRQFALHEATLVLGSLLRRFDFDLDPSYRLRVAERLTLMPRDLCPTVSVRAR